jgi:hypothetical protein
MRFYKNQEKMTVEQKYAVNFNENKNILISGGREAARLCLVHVF